jgi:aspartyl protease family protein
VSDKPEQNRKPGGRGPSWLWLLVAALATLALILWLAGDFPGAIRNGEDKAHLFYYLAWLAVLGAALIVRIRARPGTALKHAAIWVLIGAGLVLAYSFRDEAASIKDRIFAELVPYRGQIAEGGKAVVFRRAQGGHFVVEANVDGVPIRFLVDTGASDVVLSPDDAQRLGFDLHRLDYSRLYYTANGQARAAPVNLAEVKIGPITVHNVRASVNEVPLDGSLLGMSFLDRIGGYRVEGNSLTLIP